HQLGAGVIRERMAVAGVLPTVGGDFERASDAAGREDDRTSAEHLEAAALSIVSERADHAIAVAQQTHRRTLHVHVHPAMNPVVLERANHFEPGAIANMREARVAMAAEVALEDTSVRRAIEDRAPRFELAHAIGGFFR